MGAVQRRREIISYLEKNHTAYTAALCEDLHVSAMTIRRDFDYLARQGLVTLLRGGAALNRGAAVLHSLHLRQTRQPEEKRRIAGYCAEMVQEGESVFIDCGSTAECIAAALERKQNITVLTTSLDAAQILSGVRDIRFIMVPGVFVPALRGFTGQLTVDFMERFRIDRMFLGANGVDTAYGLTSPDYMDAETKRAMLSQARQVIVAADHTKIGSTYFEIIAAPSRLDLLVTDSGLEQQQADGFREKGLPVVLV